MAIEVAAIQRRMQDKDEDKSFIKEIMPAAQLASTAASIYGNVKSATPATAAQEAQESAEIQKRRMGALASWDRQMGNK